MNVQDAPIARPCPARWDQMAGTDKARFCRECRQNVYDLSAMTEDEARTFIVANPTACRRYTFDGRSGAILHRKAGCGTARVKIASRKAGALAAISLALAGPAHASVDADLDGSWLGWARDRVESWAESMAESFSEWVGWSTPPVTLGGAVALPPPETMGGSPPPQIIPEATQGEPSPVSPVTLGGKPMPLQEIQGGPHSVRHQTGR